MIEISNLTKRYGSKVALDNVSFTIERGEIVGFLGPNGAGKSTTMNIITGYISSTDGTVKVDGNDILDNPSEVKRKIGYLPEQPPLYMDMTVIDYLNFVFDLKKVKGMDKSAHIAEIMESIAITDVAKRRIGNLSKGYRQRVGLAQALIGYPEVLILDEPTVGLDPKQIIEIRNVITEMGKKHTVILSSHILSEVNAICKRVIIIKDGKIVAEDTTENLAQSAMGNTRMQISVMGDESEIRKVLSGFEKIVSVKMLSNNDDGSCDFEFECDTKLDSEFKKELFFEFAKREMPILRQDVCSASLEDIFLEVTHDDLAEEDDNVSDNEA